jgi:hypothetical protein
LAGSRPYANVELAIAAVSTTPGTRSSLIDGKGVPRVTISNLLVQKALGDGITTGPGWTVNDVTARYVHGAGIEVGAGSQASPTTLTRVLATNNGLYGLAGNGTWVVIKDSEISWNNIANHMRVVVGTGTGCDYMTGKPGGYWGAGGAKLVHAQGGSTSNPDLQLVNAQVHDNIGPGSWTDVNDRFVLVQGGRFYANEWSGYDHEIGCEIEITGAEIDHNGRPIKNTGMQGAGISINDSNGANIHDNTIHDNGAGAIELLYQQNHTGVAGMTCVTPAPVNDSDTSHVLENNSVTNNRAFSCAAAPVAGMAYGSTELLVSRHNAFDHNAYAVSDTTAHMWADPGPIAWSAWNALGLDTSGTVVSPCTYTTQPSCGN